MTAVPWCANALRRNCFDVTGGTEGSNPSPPSKESCELRYRDAGARCRAGGVTASRIAEAGRRLAGCRRCRGAERQCDAGAGGRRPFAVYGTVQHLESALGDQFGRIVRYALGVQPAVAPANARPLPAAATIARLGAVPRASSRCSPPRSRGGDGELRCRWMGRLMTAVSHFCYNAGVEGPLARRNEGLYRHRSGGRCAAKSELARL